MVHMYGVWRSFNLLPCGVAMVMEMVRCIDDLNGVGWMISGRGIGHTGSHVAMMICTMILERKRDNEGRRDKNVIIIILYQVS